MAGFKYNLLPDVSPLQRAGYNGPGEFLSLGNQLLREFIEDKRANASITACCNIYDFGKTGSSKSVATNTRKIFTLHVV